MDNEDKDIDTAWLRESSDAEEAAVLTAHLVSFRSYPGEEGAVQRAVTAWLTAQGMEPELIEIQDDRPNVLVRIENGPGPTFFLNGHTDTVLAVEGWSGDPWQGWRDGDRLYGLGACDMKSGVAAILLATRALHRRRDLWRGTVICATVPDEEAYSIGAQALVKMGLQADACVVTEATNLVVMLGSIGKVLVRGDVTGKAAHGSEPEKGINAAVEGARFLAQVDGLPLGQHPRLESVQSVLSFQSGNAQYVITVPEKARFLVNRHITPEETGETVLAQMRALADSLHSPARFDFTIDPPYYPPFEIAPDHPYVRQVVAAFVDETGAEPGFAYMRGLADANYFATDLGIPSVVFGPRGANYHMADEWVDVASIGETTRLLVRLALKVLQ